MSSRLAQHVDTSSLTDPGLATVCSYQVFAVSLLTLL
jgi:hypothetical protein